MNDKWLYGLGGVAIGALAMHMISSATRQEASKETPAPALKHGDDALKERLQKTNVRIQGDYALESPVAVNAPEISAYDWVIGQQRLGHVVGYRVDALTKELELRRCDTLRQVEYYHMMPVPTYVTGLTPQTGT